MRLTVSAGNELHKVCTAGAVITKLESLRGACKGRSGIRTGPIEVDDILLTWEKNL